MAAAAHHLLTAGTILCVAASVAASLVPPLLLARVVDRLRKARPDFCGARLFCSLALEESFPPRRRALLVLFGQKMTHALRSEMSQEVTQLPASTLAGQNPGEVTARFSGDVDTVEALLLRNYQHGSGRVPHRFDSCGYRGEKYRTGAGFAAGGAAVCRITRHVQSGCSPRSSITAARLLRCPGWCRKRFTISVPSGPSAWKAYMERRYDRRIADGYAAMERTNFYDAIYSPVVLLLNAVVVGIVMLLSASGNAEI